MAEDSEQAKKLRELITKAWSDGAFKARLLADPMAVLKENGMELPDGVTVKAVENTDKVYHLVIPLKSALSDEKLQKISGGFVNSSNDMNNSEILIFQ